MHFDYHIPTRVLFGPGRLDELHTQTLPGKKALLVISNGRSTRQHGYLQRTQTQLHLAGADHVLFDGVQANPEVADVMAGAALARRSGCDFVVALGGGSVIDAAKSIAAMACNEGDLWDYISSGTGKGRALTQPPLPVVAISTTAGTGSELDGFAVTTNPHTHEKISLRSPLLMPVLTIEDPALMTTVPPAFTAYQGFDALFHGIEGYLSRAANLLTDMYALAVIGHVAPHLPRAVADGADLTAREHVAFGNLMAGPVMSSGTLTSLHSLEHALSAYHTDLPHGAGLIMLSIPYFSHQIAHGALPERYVTMARAMGAEGASAPEDFLSALAKLQRDCGVDGLCMSSYGITPQELPAMADNARQTMGRLFTMDQVPLQQEDCIHIYRSAFR